jgi:hypothetical protein
MTSPVPDVLDEPVWYAPLRAPSRLMPPVRDDAPRAVFAANESDASDEPSLRGVRAGLPMFLAEAVRFVSDARTSSVPAGRDEPDQVVGSRARTGIVEDAGGRTLVIDIEDAGGGSLAELREHVPDDATLETVIGTLPGAVTGALASTGVRPVWSTVYVPPSPGHAAEQVRGHALCAWLLNPELHRTDPSVDADEAARKRAAVTAALSRLAELAGRSPSPFNALLLFAGLMVVRDAGSGVYLDFRLQANALCMNATDPRDPVYRISVLVFRALGDVEIAMRRARSLAGEDPALATWLTRTEAVS